MPEDKAVPAEMMLTCTFLEDMRKRSVELLTRMKSEVASNGDHLFDDGGKFRDEIRRMLVDGPVNGGMALVHEQLEKLEGPDRVFAQTMVDMARSELVSAVEHETSSIYSSELHPGMRVSDVAVAVVYHFNTEVARLRAEAEGLDLPDDFLEAIPPPIDYEEWRVKSPTETCMEKGCKNPRLGTCYDHLVVSFDDAFKKARDMCPKGQYINTEPEGTCPRCGGFFSENATGCKHPFHGRFQANAKKTKSRRKRK